MKKLGDMSPAERRAAIERARDRFQAELTAAAPEIERIMNQVDCTSEDPQHPGLTCNLMDDHVIGEHATDHYALSYRWPVTGAEANAAWIRETLLAKDPATSYAIEQVARELVSA